MAQRSNKSKHTSGLSSRPINWKVLGGVSVIGVIGLLALLILAARPVTVLTLTDYCQSEEAHCVTIGSADAPVTVAEVFDFGCPHCRDFHAETWPLLATGYVAEEQVQWLMFPYALSEDRIPVAALALCAHEQEAYLTYTQALFSGFETSDNLTNKGFQRAAAASQLEIDAFNQCLSEGRYHDIIRDNIAVAQQMGINSTPTFFINDQKVKGNIPWPQFQQQIDLWLTR